MEENKKLYENYELDSIPATEKVYSWEQSDKYDVIHWIKSSEQRQKILKMLLQEPMTTKEISERLGLKRESTYYHIKCLQKGEKIHSDKDDADSYPSLVESKTPFKRNFNLWGLTEEGLHTAQWLERE